MPDITTHKFDVSYRRLQEKLIAHTSLGHYLTFELEDGCIVALHHLDVEITFQDLSPGCQVLISGPSRNGRVNYQYACAPKPTPFPYATAVLKIAEKVEGLLHFAIDNEQRNKDRLDADERFMGWWRNVAGVGVQPMPCSASNVSSKTPSEMPEWMVLVTRSLMSGKQLQLQHSSGWHSTLLQSRPEEWSLDLHIDITKINVKEVLTILEAYANLQKRR